MAIDPDLCRRSAVDVFSGSWPASRSLLVLNVRGFGPAQEYVPWKAKAGEFPLKAL